MIVIPCQNCHRIIDVDLSVESVKVPCYLLLCQSCQIEVKNNERDKKLKKVLRRGLKEKIKEWLVNIVNSVR